MRLSIQLFGPFRQFQSGPTLALDCPGAKNLSDVRAALDAYAQSNWSGYRSSLLRSSAFATSSTVLRDGDALPADGQLAILPPVNGG